jgi:hypothetical protein
MDLSLQGCFSVPNFSVYFFPKHTAFAFADDGLSMTHLSVILYMLKP